MKLLFFNDYRMGVLQRDRVIDVTKVLEHVGIKPPETLIEEVIENFSAFRPKFEEIAAGESGIPLAEVQIRPPLPRPHNVLAAFANYQDRDQPAANPLLSSSSSWGAT